MYTIIQYTKEVKNINENLYFIVRISLDTI